MASRSSGTNGAVDDEVVEEAFVGGRTDAALRAGEERASPRRPAGAPCCGDRASAPRAACSVTMRTRASAVERVGQIDEAVVDRRGERRVGEARRDGSATSRTGVPAGTRRLEPSGSVTVIWLIARSRFGDSAFRRASRRDGSGSTFNTFPSELTAEQAGDADEGARRRSGLGATIGLRARATVRCLGASLAPRERAGLPSRVTIVRAKLVGTGGLEPPTSCVSSRRSNQLSYAPIGRLFGPYDERTV